MSKTKRITAIIIDLIFIAALTWFDRFTKNLADIHLKGKDDIPLIKDVLVLKYLEGGNRGGAFGILYGHRSLLLMVSLVFLILMLIFLICIPATKKYTILRFFICLISAGAAGNLIDRYFNGFVVDFIYVSCIDFPIFNVADIYVTVSAFALAVLILFVYKEEELDLKKANNPKLHSSMMEGSSDGGK